MRPLAPLALAFLLGLPQATAAEGDGCPAGYHKTGEQTEETPDAIIVHPICEPNPRPASADDFCKMKSLTTADIAAIKAIDFRADVESYQEFEALSTEQKASFEHKAFMAALDQGLEMADKGIDAAKSLNPWSVNTAIKDFKARGFDNPTLFAAMRKVAAAKGKPEAAEAYKAFVKLAKAGYEGYETGKDMRKDPDNAQLRFLLGALKVMQNNPELGLAVTTAEFGESYAWLYWLDRLQNERMDITETKLKQLAGLSANLKAHTGAMKAARNRYRQDTGDPGDPACDDASRPSV